MWNNSFLKYCIFISINFIPSIFNYIAWYWCSVYVFNNDQWLWRTEYFLYSAKKVKRLCTFHEVWLNSYTWLKKSENNNLYGYGKLCKKDFLISHGVKSDEQHHATSVAHKRIESSSKQSTTINSFFVTIKFNSLI